MGWSFPWASAHDGDFTFDFNVAFTEAQQQRRDRVQLPPARPRHGRGPPVPEPVARFAATCGTDPASFARDRPGMSAFAREDGAIYHTYSTYARGLDGLWGMYQWLDRAPRPQRDRPLVAPPRRVRAAVSPTRPAAVASARAGRRRRPHQRSFDLRPESSISTPHAPVAQLDRAQASGA